MEVGQSERHCVTRRELLTVVEFLPGWMAVHIAHRPWTSHLAVELPRPRGPVELNF